MGFLSKKDFYDTSPAVPVYHFGWSDDSIALLKTENQSQWYGGSFDALFEVYDGQYALYYAVFKSAGYFIHHMILPDQNRVLLDVGGALYRFLIDERQCEKENISGITSADQSFHYQALSSAADEIMVFVSTKGVCAITWETTLWKRQFDYPEYVTLKSIQDKKICIDYDGPPTSNAYTMTLNLLTGMEC